MVTLNPRLDWESGYALSGRDTSHFPWHRSLGVAWRLVGWALQQPGEQALARRFLGELDLLDTDTVDLVVTALGLAVLEQAWRRDARPDAADVLLTGIAARLDDLASHRKVKPLDAGKPDDLWPLLSAAGPAQLDTATELTRLVLIAHTADTTGPHPVSVADRLPLCPKHPGPAMLLRALTRRQLDLFIRPRLARRIQTEGQFRTDDGVLACPRCGTTRRLQLSCQATGPEVTATCPDGHTWPVPQLSPDDLERILEEEVQRRSGSDG